MDLSPALAINLKDSTSDILAGKLWRITEKIDGVRRLFYKDKNGKITSYTKTGKRDDWLGHIGLYLERKNFPADTIYDCELVDRDLYFSGKDSFILRAVTTGKASQQFKANKTDLVAICFDLFSPDGDLRIGSERHFRLSSAFNEVPLGSPIFAVPYYGVLNGNDIKVLNYLMDRITSRNGEGLMLMNLHAPYIHGRSNELIKVKRFEEFIGRVIDVEFASAGTKIEGGISALICEVPGCTVPVRVGSGFTNKERKYFVEYSPIGLFIEIDAFGKTQDAKNDISLSMPVFKQLSERIE